MATTSYGTLIPAPAWYNPALPKFYRDSSGNILLRPLNSVPNFTTEDVLDCALYLQTIIGYNRFDISNAKCAAWVNSNGSAQMWIKSAFKTDGNGNGGGNFAAVSSNGLGIDGAFYSQLQARYVFLNSTAMPWLKDMQAVGGGIDLITIPMATDNEVPRPSWYPKYLPSLFISSGQPFQQPAGSLNTKPKIRNYISSGYKQYTITAKDVASLMLYTQPVVLQGPTPYPVNWYINDDVNGAMANYFKITLAPNVAGAHTNAQMQTWGIVGDLMKAPVLDANPFASGFSQALEGVIKFVISFFAAKIPAGSTLANTASKVAAMGGAGISGGEVPPAGTFTASVYAAADQIAASLQGADKNKTWLLLAAALAGLGWWAHDEGYF